MISPEDNSPEDLYLKVPDAPGAGEAEGWSARKPRRQGSPTYLRRRAEVFLRLRAICKNHSVSEIAELTDTHQETTRRYLADKTPASPSFLGAICDALGVSAEWLLCGRGGIYRADQPGTPSAAVQDRIEEVSNATTEIERALSKLVEDSQ